MRVALRTLACRAFLAVAAAAFMSGCTAPRSALLREPSRIESRIDALQGSLRGLGKATDPEEARRVAQTAVADSLKLAYACS